MYGHELEFNIFLKLHMLIYHFSVWVFHYGLFLSVQFLGT